MGTYRLHLDANRTAVRALDAAHECPRLGGSWSELPFGPEPPG